MTREEMATILKCRSMWKFNKSMNNYKLPGGRMLTEYLSDLLWQQMELDRVLIRKDGEFAMNLTPEEWEKDNKMWDKYKIAASMGSEDEDEICPFEVQEKRVKHFVMSLVR